MAEEELIIRHVRLCDCGKVAGHNGICRPPRTAAGFEPDDVDPVDDDTAEVFARRRERVFTRDAPRYRSERVGHRSRLNVRALQAQVDVQVAELSPIGAGNISPSHGSSGHPSQNLALLAWSVDLDADPRWRMAVQRERDSVLRQLELLDEIRGLGVAQAERELTGEEKDAEIVSPANADLSAAEFASKFPGYGAPTTIARKRRWYERGLCTFSGVPPHSGCHCPTCRKGGM